MDSRRVGSYSAQGIPVLDVHELATGGLRALFARTSGRDLFDAHDCCLKPAWSWSVSGWHSWCTGLCSGETKERSRWRTSPSTGENSRGSSCRHSGAIHFPDGLPPAAWAARLVEETREALGTLLPFTEPESDFLDRLLDRGEIAPELITDDEELADRIRRHPSPALEGAERLNTRAVIDGAVCPVRPLIAAQQKSACGEAIPGPRQKTCGKAVNTGRYGFRDSEKRNNKLVDPAWLPCPGAYLYTQYWSHHRALEGVEKWGHNCDGSSTSPPLGYA